MVSVKRTAFLFQRSTRDNTVSAADRPPKRLLPDISRAADSFAQKTYLIVVVQQNAALGDYNKTEYQLQPVACDSGATSYTAISPSAGKHEEI